MVESKKNFDIIIEGGTLLTMVDGEEPVRDARVIISGDSIEGVSVRKNSPLPEADEIINAGDTIILPGLINTDQSIILLTKEQKALFFSSYLLGLYYSWQWGEVN